MGSAGPVPVPEGRYNPPAPPCSGLVAGVWVPVLPNRSCSGECTAGPFTPLAGSIADPESDPAAAAVMEVEDRSQRRASSCCHGCCPCCCCCSCLCAEDQSNSTPLHGHRLRCSHAGDCHATCLGAGCSCAPKAAATTAVLSDVLASMCVSGLDVSCASDADVAAAPHRRVRLRSSRGADCMLDTPSSDRSPETWGQATCPHHFAVCPAACLHEHWHTSVHLTLTSHETHTFHRRRPSL